MCFMSASDAIIIRRIVSEDIPNFQTFIYHCSIVSGLMMVKAGRRNLALKNKANLKISSCLLLVIKLGLNFN